MSPVDPFDQDHQLALDLLSQLIPGRNQLSVIGKLVDHVSFHFSEESHLMRQCRYPNREGHLEEHSDIQDLFLLYIPKMIRGSITQEEIDLVRDRLTLHMDTQDTHLTRYVNAYYPELVNKYGIKGQPEPSLDNGPTPVG